MIRAPAAASIRFCLAACRYCSDHAVKPRMMPWLERRFIAFCASCSTRFSFSSAARSARISSTEPVSSILCFSRALSLSSSANFF